MLVLEHGFIKKFQFFSEVLYVHLFEIGFERCGRGVI